MKTKSTLGIMLGVVAFTFALCLSVSAAPEGKNVVERTTDRPVAKTVIYYVKSSASAIPQPIDRLGGIPTTTVPMQVIGDPR